MGITYLIGGMGACGICMGLPVDEVVPTFPRMRKDTFHKSVLQKLASHNQLEALNNYILNNLTKSADSIGDEDKS